MFLKSIEIRGFKSFADKTELTFKQGVTAVVGPNGSGKSNISDAVRWVLGEQSIRNLRGDKMEDVIFAGTQYRKPVGLAQVSLTLDNSDSDLDIAYSQVTVARRLYRSGDSEYLINNTVCRLKDVQALFMDTGIGKEGYSLIGQGKIDAILSAKSEDRRKLLEEAAGIVKYKTRKEEAERRLENTQQNLLRINDIISTYEERLPALEVDCEKAKIFLEASEEMKVKEVNIIVDFLEKTKFTIDKINGDIKSVTLSQKNLNGEKNQLKIDLDEKNQELDKINSVVDEKKRLYYEAQSQHQTILGEVKLYEEKIIHLTETMDRLKKESEEKALIIEEQVRILEGKQNSLERLKQEEKDIDEKVSVKEAEISKVVKDVTEFNEKMKALESTKFRYYNDINSKNNEEGILKNNIELCGENLEKLILDVQTFKNSILINTKTKAHLEEEKTDADDKIEKYEEQVKENRKRIIKAKHELE
ncbi:MAG: AAA family ATPase, partial [Clostridium sp.]